MWVHRLFTHEEGSKRSSESDQGAVRWMSVKLTGKTVAAVKFLSAQQDPCHPRPLPPRLRWQAEQSKSLPCLPLPLLPNSATTPSYCASDLPKDLPKDSIVLRRSLVIWKCLLRINMSKGGSAKQWGANALFDGFVKEKVESAESGTFFIFQ